jgi:dephospho-CoA kinase
VTPAPLRRVALTGGIASGKSYCLSRFAELRVPTIDADVLAREAIEPGTAAFAAVVARFGPEVVSPDGRLDRAALGRRVFDDTPARRDLEQIIHPAVYATINRWFAALENDAGGHFAIADVPLLYETGHAAEFDAVIVTSCQPEQQLQRLMARGGLTESEARQRISAQLPLADKVRRADYVIDTSGDRSDTDRQVVEVFERLRALQEEGQKAKGKGQR